MFDLFDFDLPGAVNKQLEQRLQSMPSTILSDQALHDLVRFQEQHKIRQGVYQIPLGDHVVYPTIGQLLALLKNQLPFVFRYKVHPPDDAKPVNLLGVPVTARCSINQALSVLGPGWQATIFLSHIILYQRTPRLSPCGRSIATLVKQNFV